MKYVSTKAYRDFGPVAYRQWRAESHCRHVHGYSLSFYVEFESDKLDVRNWVVDFGSLKSFKHQLEDWFDHTFLVSEDDPELKTFEDLHNRDIIKMVVVERTGCEGLAKFIFDYLEEIWLPDNGYKTSEREVFVRRVEVRETENNMAYVTRE